MNLRKLWTELFQKPAGRLVLFLVAGALILTFILTRNGQRSPEPVNTSVPAQVTKATGYSFNEDIPEPTRAKSTTPTQPASDSPIARPGPTPKAPPPIPQTIFATKEAPRSENYLPFGRLL